MQGLCRTAYPELSRKQKIHLFLHVVDSMKAFGPTSSYCTERYNTKSTNHNFNGHCPTYRCETFNGLMREQNIYGNHQAPSLDIATRFALMDHVRYLSVCDGGLSENKMM